MNVDCEIYIKNFVSFFNNNPSDLESLIGNIQKDIFYQKVREEVHRKCDKGDEFVLSQQELIKILVELHDEHTPKKKIDPAIQFTNLGPLFLN